MPNPRQLRFAAGNLDLDEQTRIAQSLVAQLRNSEDPGAVAAAAEELYKMTSMATAVAIDIPEAMTDYDRAVFGAGDGSAATGSTTAGGLRPDSNGLRPGEEHIDGHCYLMGDGFMMDESQNDGSVRTRRVPVMHSRNCIDNRSIIGKVPGVFEALVHAMRSSHGSSRYQACRAASQIVFRNADNKRAFGGTPGALGAISHVCILAAEQHDKRTLAQACRVLGVLVSGDVNNSTMAAQDEGLVNVLRACLTDSQDEVSGQAGKVLNGISYLIPSESKTG